MASAPLCAGGKTIRVLPTSEVLQGPAGIERVGPASAGWEYFGFLGCNGAGKTTTIKTLMGLLRSDSGTAEVFGVPVTEDKELYPYMTLEQLIRFTRPFFPKSREDLEQRLSSRSNAATG
jgi:ABC-type Na+ transport system ATPase subunit NatA